MTLTIKQEKFCQAYVETGNASEAYRLAYDADNMNQATNTGQNYQVISTLTIQLRI